MTEPETLKTTQLKTLIESLRRAHLVVEDCWYSCPKSGDCCNHELEDCTCGADSHNKTLDKIIAILESKESLDKPEKEKKGDG